MKRQCWHHLMISLCVSHTKKVWRISTAPWFPARLRPKTGCILGPKSGVTFGTHNLPQNHDNEQSRYQGFAAPFGYHFGACFWGPLAHPLFSSDLKSNCEPVATLTAKPRQEKQLLAILLVVHVQCVCIHMLLWSSSSILCFWTFRVSTPVSSLYTNASSAGIPFLQSSPVGWSSFSKAHKTYVLNASRQKHYAEVIGELVNKDSLAS